MTNQTLIQVPPNLADVNVIQRFLTRLVEELDIILGFRGDNAYATDTTLAETVGAINSSIASLQKNLSDLTAVVEELTVDVQNKIDALIDITWIHSFIVHFTGSATNGPITLVKSYNVTSAERIDVGVYRFQLEQSKIYGEPVVNALTPAVSWNMPATLFYANIEVVDNTTFDVKVYSVDSASNLVPHDPVQPGDLVIATGSFNVYGDLPPL